MRHKFWAILFLAFGTIACGAEPFYTEIGILSSDISRARTRLESMNDSFLISFYGREEWIDVMKAVVFPEVLRYSGMVDEVQTILDRVQFGDKSIFDYSIGPFQIKPGFVIKLRTESIAKNLVGFRVLPDQQEELVGIINSESGSILILRLFLEVFLAGNPELVVLPDTQKVRILASAYTYGRFRDFSELAEVSTISTWSMPRMAFAGKVPYADVSLYYWKMISDDHNISEKAR